MTVTNTPNAIINWANFSINTNETVRFMQQSAASAVLNRVTGRDPSSILGALQSNGKVFLINPNGIMFGAGSRIDVNGLVASTLNMTDADFLNGRLRFNADRAVPGDVKNVGEIKTPAGGFVYLLAPNVENSGIITTPSGKVVLAAGNSVELVDPDTPDVRVLVSAKSQDVTVASNGNIFSVLNSGKVSANAAVQDASGKIYFKSAGNIQTATTSVVEAKGDSAANGGRIQAFADGTGAYAGSFDASGKNGGFIETSGHTLDINNISISAQALDPHGLPGTWLLDPYDYTIGTIEASYISTALNSGTSVSISTSSPSSTVSYGSITGRPGLGDITVDAFIGHSGSSLASFSLNADRDIIFTANGQIKNTSPTAGRFDVFMSAQRNITFNSGSYIDVASYGGGSTYAYAGKDIAMTNAGIKANWIWLFSGNDISINGYSTNIGNSLWATMSNGDAWIGGYASRNFSTTGASIMANATANTGNNGSAWINLFGVNSTSLIGNTSISASGSNTNPSAAGACTVTSISCSGSAGIAIDSLGTIVVEGSITAAASSAGLGGQANIDIGDTFHPAPGITVSAAPSIPAVSFISGTASVKLTNATLNATSTNAVGGINQSWINIDAMSVSASGSSFKAYGGVELDGWNSLLLQNSTINVGGGAKGAAEGALLVSQNLMLDSASVYASSGAIGLNFDPEFIKTHTAAFLGFVKTATVTLKNSSINAYDGVGFSGKDIILTNSSMSANANLAGTGCLGLGGCMLGIVLGDLRLNSSDLSAQHEMLLTVDGHLHLDNNSHINVSSPLTLRFKFPLLASDGWLVDGVASAFSGPSGSYIHVAGAPPVLNGNFFVTYGGPSVINGVLSRTNKDLLTSTNTTSLIEHTLLVDAPKGDDFFGNGENDNGNGNSEENSKDKESKDKKDKPQQCS
jgi:filamentous hemagglutinin family protein